MKGEGRLMQAKEKFMFLFEMEPKTKKTVLLAD